jgi:hypothetical protein
MLLLEMAIATAIIEVSAMIGCGSVHRNSDSFDRYT